MSGTVLERELEQVTTRDPLKEWQVVVHDDPVNLMNYVTWVFMDHFRLPKDEAHAKMLEVHNSGRAVLDHGNREHMERHAAAMQRYGLWATIEEMP